MQLANALEINEQRNSKVLDSPEKVKNLIKTQREIEIFFSKLFVLILNNI